MSKWHPAWSVRVTLLSRQVVSYKNFKGEFFACPWVSILPSYCIRNWPLPTGAIQDQSKQNNLNKYSNKHNQVKNPNWREADQLAIYKHSQEVELGAGSNISWQSEQDLNLGPKDFKSGASITQPHCLLTSLSNG